MSRTKLPAIDVVVLCLGRLEDTLECIDSVLGQDYPDVRLWVQDQGSDEAMIEALKTRSSADGFHFDREKKIGVPAGRNKGYRMGEAPVIVALDNDAVLEDAGVLSRVGRRFSKDDKLGVLAFSVHDYQTGEPDLGSWGYPWPVETHFQKEFLSARFCGAGHAVRREAFEAASGYDEQLFFFGEELDLSWSVISLGYEVRYVPDIGVRHKSSLEERIDWATGRYYYNVRNMLYLTRKYLGDPLLLAAYLGGYLFKGLRNGLVKPAIKGAWDGLRLQTTGNDQTALEKSAKRYIMQHEYAPRGSSWRRFRKEILSRLNPTGSP